MSVKRYEWVACDEHACHCDVIESAEGDMVDYEDYAALEARCAALAAENAGLKSFISQSCYSYDGDGSDVCDSYVNAEESQMFPKTPATEAFLAGVQSKAREEGAYFVANRMLAAWDAGFIDDTARNAADIARMILTSTEFMADAPEGDFDRSFADGVLEDIAAQLRKGVQS
ncbi:ead/Ea22-like family protein [Enterobacter hormaechei]|uniref:ead/Ea22-like family protein n=1 Tax=Enterobacter hormaechei TaxID=158836 RepID=UPI0034CE0ACE